MGISNGLSNCHKTKQFLLCSVSAKQSNTGKQVPKSPSKHWGKPPTIIRISSNRLRYPTILYMYMAYVVPIWAFWLLSQTQWVPMSKESFSVKFLGLSLSHWGFTWKVSALHNPLHQPRNRIQTKSNQIRKSPRLMGKMFRDNCFLQEEAGKRDWKKYVWFHEVWFGLIWISASVERLIGVKKFHQIPYLSLQ